ncbi:Jerky -like [Araneus ventricosus]|uniref:Jerky-like n=1 Tax=Araneus ventricosus TaxID=182803 RepID=A0A4Y2RC45_ARAVE|nr:Jerky -like [Araneus ventricosus]
MQTRNPASPEETTLCSADLWLFNNCPGHPSAELCTDDDEISAMFLPSNSTALIQLMGQNVIQNVKLGYRNLLLGNIRIDPVHNENLEKRLTNVNLKDVVFSLANCWAYVSTLLINKSWKILLPNFIDSEVEEIQLASLINQLQNTNPKSNTEAFQWAAEVDDSLVRNEILTDDEIIRKVTAEDDNADDVIPVNPVKISHSEAVAALKTSLQWAEEQSFEAHEIMLLGRLKDRAFELKIGTAAQKKINAFFEQ